MRCACSTPVRAASTGSPTPLPAYGAHTSTPACLPTTSSCCTAFGRCRSAAMSSGTCRCSFSQLPSLPASVVLPAPCRPASITTVGGVFARWIGRASPPRMVTSSSLTILMTCWAGLSACDTSEPRARSLIAAMNSRTTGSATSASSSAMRISRAVASMSASDSRPLPRSDLKTVSSRSDRVSNIRLYTLVGCRGLLGRLDLDAAAGVHRLDRLGVAREHATPLELHGRRQGVTVGQPLLAEDDDAPDVLDVREAPVCLRHRSGELALHLGVGGDVGECAAGEPHGRGIRVDGEYADEVRPRIADRHRLPDQRNRLQRGLDVGRRHVLAAGGDQELFLPVDDPQVAVLVELTDVT